MIWIIITGLVVIFLYSLLFNFAEKEKENFIGFIGFLLILFVVTLTLLLSNKVYYKQGQIDALNGIIKYEKEVQIKTDTIEIWKETK